MPEKTKGQSLYSLPLYTDALMRDASALTYQKIREIRKHPTVRLVRTIMSAPISFVPWQYIAAENAPEGAREEIVLQFEKLRQSLMLQMAKAVIDYGWQSYEKVWKINTRGYYELKKLKPLLHDITDIVVDARGKFKGLRQERDSVTLEVVDSLLVSVGVEGTNWYGESYYNALAPYIDRYDCVLETAERYDTKVAGSHWIVHYPEGQSNYNGVVKDNYDVAVEILKALIASGGVVVPSTLASTVNSLNSESAGTARAWEIEIISAASGRSSFSERAKMYDTYIVRAMGWPERAILEGEYGTKAESEAHGDFGILGLDALNISLVDHLNPHCVDQILYLNWGEAAVGTVRIRPEPIANIDRVFYKQLYMKLLDLPIQQLEELSLLDFDELRRALNIPIREDQQSTTPAAKEEDVVLPQEDN